MTLIKPLRPLERQNLRSPAKRLVLFRVDGYAFLLPSEPRIYQRVANYIGSSGVRAWVHRKT